MWSENDGPYVGKHYELAETLCVPAPISSPRPPLLVAGGGERKTLRLVARYADQCNLFGTPAEVAAKLEILRRHCATEGRDYAEITPTVLTRLDPFADLDAFLREMESFAALGVGVIALGTRVPAPDFARRIGQDVVPRLVELGRPPVRRRSRPDGGAGRWTPRR